jgi:hypothetical protein
MKETSMEIEWRTIQLFLDEDGISEVELDYNNRKKIRCNCKDFSGLAKCKHVKFVRLELDKNNGAYSIKVPDDVDDDEAFEALEDPASFRSFIIKYGKILVIK